jgi:hypothetical protein
MNIGGPISGVNGPQVMTYAAPDQSVGFGSVIIYNSSGSTVNVYVGQQGTAGLPNFQVSPNVVTTYPIPGIPFVTVQLATFPTTGQVGVTLTDAVLSAASSVMPSNVGGAAQMQTTAYSFTQSAPFMNAQVLSAPAAAQNIYVYSYSFFGVNYTAASTAVVQFYDPVGSGVFLFMLDNNGAGVARQVSLALSGGSLPLWVLTKGRPMLCELYSVFGTAASVSAFFNYTYAVF